MGFLIGADLLKDTRQNVCKRVMVVNDYWLIGYDEHRRVALFNINFTRTANDCTTNRSTNVTVGWSSLLKRNSFRFCPGSRTYFNEVLPKIFEFEFCPWIGRKYQTRCLRCSAGTILTYGLKGHPISIARPITTEYCFACRILSTTADTSWWQIKSLLMQKRSFITYGS